MPPTKNMMSALQYSLSASFPKWKYEWRNWLYKNYVHMKMLIVLKGKPQMHSTIMTVETW